MFVSGSRARIRVSATAPAYLRNIEKASAEKNLANSTFSLCGARSDLGTTGSRPLFLLSVIGRAAMFAKKMLFLKVFRNGDGLGVCGDRFQGHGCNLLKNHGGVRGVRGRRSPAKRPMTCHEHTWRVERLLVLKSADDGVARIHFVAGSNFL